MKPYTVDIFNVGDDPLDSIEHVGIVSDKFIVADFGRAAIKANRKMAEAFLARFYAYGAMREALEAVVRHKRPGGLLSQVGPMVRIPESVYEQAKAALAAGKE